MSARKASGGSGAGNISRALTSALAVLLMVPTLVACSAGSSAGDKPPLIIGGIPDQDYTVLQERFDGVASYLSDKLGVDVQYQPSTDYAALVTAFRNGDVKLAWFGGLTGVQARLAVPGANAIIQRPIDKTFRSVFIVGSGVNASTLSELKGLTFTFGSESSTSGHLMPRYYLNQAGVDPETDFNGPPGYSGSHDTTIQLVEAGTYQAGALNSTVWDSRLADGTVDTSKVREIYRTPPYFDYHWVAHPDLDKVYGKGFTDKIVQAFLDMKNDPAAAHTLELFQTDSFITTNNANYAMIEEVARQLGLIGG